MIQEAIILAGGLGTRLRGTVPDLPKCMAPVAGKPFLFYVINYLRIQGVQTFIFSLGYKHEVIEKYLQEEFSTLDYKLAVEQEPLGTGGAIQLACTMANDDHVLIANGDTLFKIDIQELENAHQQCHAACTLSLKPMTHFDRYGVVKLDPNGRVNNFNEKKYYEAGLINGGIYLLDRKQFLDKELPAKFSFEKEYLEAFCPEGKFYGVRQEGYFIDIGIPEDYERAQRELQLPTFHLSDVGEDWTLFIDRDGVINHEKEGGYILNKDEFVFYDGVAEAFRKLGQRFGKIVVVTNQRGIGRGLMTEDDLQDIHGHMGREISRAGGRIDAIYYCSSVDTKHPDRKPNPGMAVKAWRESPGIHLSRSVMVGNNMSDMKFARNAGIRAVFLRTTHPNQPFPHPDIDLVFDSLKSFADQLDQTR